METYCSNIDSSKFPIHKDSLIYRYARNFNNCLRIFPNYATNFDSLKSIQIATNKLLDFPERINKDETIKLYRSIFNECLKIGINERNNFFIHSIQDVFKYTNKQIGILRMGSGHMDPTVIQGFRKKLLHYKPYVSKTISHILFLNQKV